MSPGVEYLTEWYQFPAQWVSSAEQVNQNLEKCFVSISRLRACSYGNALANRCRLRLWRGRSGISCLYAAMEIYIFCLPLGTAGGKFQAMWDVSRNELCAFFRDL